MNKKHATLSAPIFWRWRSCFLMPLLFICGMMQAVCMPQDTLTQASPAREKIYLHGNAQIIVAGASFISGAELVQVKTVSARKSKTIKKAHTEKTRLITREARLPKKTYNTPKPAESINPADPDQAITGNTSGSKPLSVSSHSSYKILSAEVSNIILQSLLPVLIKDSSYRRNHWTNLFFYAQLFQRPPPVGA